jgi:hypothetical protein
VAAGELLPSTWDVNWQGVNVGCPTTSAAAMTRCSDDPPPAWRQLLSGSDYHAALAAIGAERLRELRPFLAEVSPAFRRRFLDHLCPLATHYQEGQAVILALARATDEAIQEGAQR